ncbi:restriction endonuclease subunit S [Cyanobium sp. CH-040]|uniref:restriction endonuclease subunit S n=1 Tax=Cyanobium sp. CH-040 TaxID=2823708 RepID=UPI0020CE7422|nr:restriction endonuclease subunit S [Cyanobium sp. CH-040]MCP9928588.1 restriction endonuclease subunit S [Cyanobium sp. CH-040]
MSFPRYPAYKDSGVEWLGEVPEHWEVKQLKNCLTANNGGVWGEEPTGRSDTIVLRSTEQTVDGLWVIDQPAYRYLSEKEKKGASLKSGDLVITKSSGSSLHIGKTSLVTDEVEALSCCYSNFMQRITPCSMLLPKLVWYWLNSDISRHQFNYYSSSTTGLANLNAGIIGRIALSLPPKAEQIQLLSFLDHETAKIDALIAEQQQLIELLQEKRQAAISHAVTKGLNPDVPMKDSGVEWLGKVPEHWEIKRMKHVARMESGHTPDRKINAYWQNCDIPWVSLNDTGYLRDHDYITETAYSINSLGIENSSARLLPERVVVFSRDATIGRCAITTRPMAVSQHFIAWVCSEELRPEYLLLRLRSMTAELDRLTAGATLKTIGMPDVKTLVTPLPPLCEQDAIVDKVAAITKDLDDLMTDASRAVALLQERRSALISAAVSGQIDVRGVVPAEVAA